MRKLFRRIFNLDKVEKVEMLERMVVYKQGWVETLTKQRNDLMGKVEVIKCLKKTMVG